MSKFVWALTVLLAVAFLLVGLGKVTAASAEMEAAAGGIPVNLLRVAGVAEVVGAVGLVLPSATRVMPVLAPVAAGGLVLTMVGAIVANVATGQYEASAVPAGLGVLAAFVAWARGFRWPIGARTSAHVRRRDVEAAG